MRIQYVFKTTYPTELSEHVVIPFNTMQTSKLIRISQSSHCYSMLQTSVIKSFDKHYTNE
jgi:hypothetical protein